MSDTTIQPVPFPSDDPDGVGGQQTDNTQNEIVTPDMPYQDLTDGFGDQSDSMSNEESNEANSGYLAN